MLYSVSVTVMRVAKYAEVTRFQYVEGLTLNHKVACCVFKSRGVDHPDKAVFIQGLFAYFIVNTRMNATCAQA